MAKIKEQVINRNLTVVGDLTVVGEINRGELVNAGNVAKADAHSIKKRTTYDDIIDGFDAGGGTTTPTVPAITVCKPVGSKAIMLEWDRQLDLTNFSRYEVQVSSDNTNWYSLRFDGVDWKGVVTEDTDWQPEMLLHTMIPYGGTSDAPTGVTLYYRIRRVTKTPSVSAWSASASTTTVPVDVGDIAAGAIKQSKMLAGLTIPVIVAALPGLPNAAYPAGSLAVLTTDSKLYRSTGAAWTRATDGADISADSIVAASIAAGAIGADELAADSVVAGKIAANAVDAGSIDALVVTAREIAALTITASQIAANTITASKIVSAEINTLLLNATAAVIIGYAGTGSNASPAEGDRRAYIDDDELGLEVYTNGAWATARSIKLGGVDGSGNFLPFLACRGLLGDMGDAPTSDPVPDASFYRFNFDNAITDQNGVDPWTVNLGGVGYDTTIKWEGTHSLEPTGTLLNMTWTTSWTAGTSTTAAFMLRIPTMGFGHTLLEWNASNLDDHIYVSIGSNRIITTEVNKGGTETSVASAALSINTWHFIAITYNSVTNTLYMRVDSIEYELVPTGAWGAGTKSFYLSLGGPDSQQEYMDDLIVSFSAAIDPDLFFQHVNRNTAWTTEYTAKDLFLIPRTGGRIFFGSPVAAEPSLGTHHEMAYANRTASLLVDTSTTPAATWSAAVTMSYAPVGAKAGYCFMYRTSGANPDAFVAAMASGMTLDTAAGFQYKYPGVHLEIGGYGDGMVWIPIDANKQFKWCTVAGNALARIGSPVAYLS